MPPSSNNFKALPFDPVLVVWQILFLSAATYTTLGLSSTLAGLLFGLQLTADVLTFEAISPFTAEGWLLMGLYGLNALVR
jgi:hypothetical protein